MTTETGSMYSGAVARFLASLALLSLVACGSDPGTTHLGGSAAGEGGNHMAGSPSISDSGAHSDSTGGSAAAIGTLPTENTSGAGGTLPVGSSAFGGLGSGATGGLMTQAVGGTSAEAGTGGNRAASGGASGVGGLFATSGGSIATSGGGGTLAGAPGGSDGNAAGGSDGDAAGGSDGDAAGGSDGDAAGGSDGDAAGGSDGDAAGGSGSGGLDAPSYETDFADGSGWGDRSDPTGSVQYGIDGGQDGNVAVLSFPGDPALGAADNTSPAHATEIYWQERQYGTFRARVELAQCSAGEEVVNGIFTYSHGGDTNGNGITDNSEIDIEILCGEPYIIFLTSWTDYDDDNNFRKWSRAIDTRTGDYQESPTATEYGLGPVLGNIPGAYVPGFPETGRFYEMGFEWKPESIRWFMVFDTEEVTLWDFGDATLVPQNPAAFLFNVWHAPSHWFDGGSADYPASDAVMRVDWFRYWAHEAS